MRLILNTDQIQFQSVGSCEPRLDKDGVHRKDKQGGTGLPLYAVKLIAWMGSDTETVLVSVPAATPPVLGQGDFVVVEGLEAMPWVSNGNVRVAFRATSILPVNTATK